MDLKQVEKLISVMEQSQVKRLVIRKEGFEIELEMDRQKDHYLPSSGHSQHFANAAPEQARIEPPPAAQAEPDYLFVTSPMVGTFYAAPSPEDAPYAKKGDVVNENSVVCIIEAMKVMNEVKAGVQGTILEVLVKNGDPLEFGSKIFRVQKA